MDGPDGGERLGRVLDGSSSFVELDRGWVLIPALLDGTTWCTTVADDDAAAGFLPLDPDLALLGWSALDETMHIADPGGALAALVATDDDGLLGPDGWLKSFGGRTIGVRITGTTLELAPVDDVDVDQALATAVRQAFDAHTSREQLVQTFPTEAVFELVHISLADLLWEALAHDRAAFLTAPIPPVDVVLAAAGLERSHHLVAGAGFDWAVLARWHRRNRLAGMHHVPAELVEYAELVLRLSDAVIDGEPDAFGEPEVERTGALVAAGALGSPAVAEAFMTEHLGNDTRPEDLLRFARWVTARIDGRAESGSRWVAARALDLLGQPGDAEAELELAAADEHPLAVASLAAFRADRGDAKGALALLRRAGVDHDDELLHEVVGYATVRPKPSAGRNDPCPCGSGRKYKACHLGRERVALADRGPWLYAKARRYLRDHVGALERSLAAAMYAASGRGYEVMRQLQDSELVADLALCEAGVFGRFVAERSELLPDDEALLAAQWELVERSLFEIDRRRRRPARAPRRPYR